VAKRKNHIIFPTRNLTSVVQPVAYSLYRLSYSDSCFPIIYLIFPYLLLDLPDDRFLRYFPIKILYVFLFPPIAVTPGDTLILP
jgi:hypothetical protein